MIFELGRLKDQGLRTYILREAGLSLDPSNETDVLKHASDICRVYFAESSLTRLIKSREGAS
jgi:hypothetical protein